MTSEKKDNNQKYLNFWNAVFLGVLFLIGYIPFMTVQNLLTEIQDVNGFGSLGFYLLAVLYLFQMVAAVFAASIVSKLGLKGTFAFGYFCLSMMAFFQILTAWRADQISDGNDNESSFFMKREVVIPFLFLGQILTGFGSAIIWTAQGEYIAECATESSQGFYFGLFWSIYMSSQIFGNLIGALIITNTSGPSFFLVMGLIMIGAVIGFAFLKLPKKFEGDDGHHEEEQPSFFQLLKNTVKLIFTAKMMLFNFQLIFTGISISYWSGIITPVVVFQLNNDPEYKDRGYTDNEKEQYALYTMISFGFGEVIGGLIMGWFIDKFNSKMATLLNMLVIVIMTGVSLYSIYSEKYNWVSFLMAFMWGVEDGTFNIHTFRTLGFEFETQSEPFGVFNLVQGFAVFICQIIQGQLDVTSQFQLLIYTIVLGVLGILSCCAAYMFPYKLNDADAASKRQSVLDQFPDTNDFRDTDKGRLLNKSSVRDTYKSITAQSNPQDQVDPQAVENNAGQTALPDVDIVQEKIDKLDDRYEN